MENNSQNIYFSFNLKFLREKYELTQKELANHIGTSRDNITKYEDGVVPKLPAMLNIVKFFHIPFEKMCEEKADGTWIFPRGENQNAHLKCTPNSTPISKTEELGVHFEQGQAQEGYNREVEALKAQIAALQGQLQSQAVLLQERGERISELKEAIKGLNERISELKANNPIPVPLPALPTAIL